MHTDTELRRDTQTVGILPVLDREMARQETREWIDFICTRKRWTGSDLARRSGLVPSTVLRLKNKKDYAYLPSYSTIRAISLGSGFKIPESLTRAFGCESDEQTSKGQRIYHDLRKTSAVDTIPVRYLSCLPPEIQFPMPDETAVECPVSLRGKKAFAFRLDDHALEPLIPHGSMLYAVDRDPVPGDLAVITRTDNRSLVRLVDEAGDDGLMIINPKGVKSWIDRATMRSVAVVVISERR